MQEGRPKEGEKGRGNDGGGLDVVLLIYVKSDPYKSTWKDVGCHLHVSSVRFSWTSNEWRLLK